MIRQEPNQQYGRKYVVEIGRHRVMLRFCADLRAFQWGLRRQSRGAWDGGFGFGMFTYLRRNYR